MRTDESGARLAGFAAFLAGLAWVTWSVVNAYAHGGLDIGPAAVGEHLARAGSLLMVAWNVLLLPAALVLHSHLVDLHPHRVRLATICGIASLLFWAYGGATHTITPELEVGYLVLSAAWWLGIGATLWASNRIFGGLTVTLGAFAFWDAVLTGFEPVPFSLYVTAAPKLPLSILWDFALAYVLIAGCRTRDYTPLPAVPIVGGGEAP